MGFVRLIEVEECSDCPYYEDVNYYCNLSLETCLDDTADPPATCPLRVQSIILELKDQ